MDKVRQIIMYPKMHKPKPFCKIGASGEANTPDGKDKWFTENMSPRRKRKGGRRG